MDDLALGEQNQSFDQIPQLTRVSRPREITKEAHRVFSDTLRLGAMPLLGLLQKSGSPAAECRRDVCGGGMRSGSL
jgi:hypothetical protein